MSAPMLQRRIHPQRLLWPLVGLFLLSAALQGASLVAVLRIEESLEVSRRQLEVAQSQDALADQFETAAYLAVVGLATSDWELLLRQRSATQALAERFTAV